MSRNRTLAAAAACLSLGAAMSALAGDMPPPPSSSTSTMDMPALPTGDPDMMPALPSNDAGGVDIPAIPGAPAPGPSPEPLDETGGFFVPPPPGTVAPDASSTQENSTSGSSARAEEEFAPGPSGPGGKSRYRYGDPRPKWPGSFIGLRGALAAGLDRVPGMSSGAVSMAGNDSLHLAPYLGTEFGYSTEKGGASIVLEGSGLAFPPSNASPILGHMMITAEGMYVYSPTVRLVAGYSFLNYMHVSYGVGNVSSGVDLKGPGFRLGAHFRMTKPVAFHNWEWFVYGMVNRMTDATVFAQSTDSSGKTTTLANAGQIPVGGDSWLAFGGFQYSFTW